MLHLSNRKSAASAKPIPGREALIPVQADHVHLFRSSPPSVAPSQLAHTLKGTTGRLVWQCFPERNSFGALPSGLVRPTWVVSEI